MKKILLLLVIALAVYVGYLARKEKPGMGPKARSGKAATQPVINAIEAYRTAHNMYPADLDDLRSENSTLPRSIEGHGIDYDRHGATYEVSFSYTTPLPVHCTYTPSRWKCGYL